MGRKIGRGSFGREQKVGESYRSGPEIGEGAKLPNAELAIKYIVYDK